MQSIAGKCWRHWIWLYSLEPQKRVKWKPVSRSMQQGTNTPRCLWPLALEKEVRHEQDGPEWPSVHAYK